MKKTFTTIIAALFTVVAMAQTISEQTISGKTFAAVTMQTENAELENVKIMLDASSAKKFIKNLRKLEGKVASMNEAAAKKAAKKSRKTLAGSYSFDKMSFACEGNNSIVDESMNNYLIPYFDVDAEGNTHLMLGGYYSGYNASATLDDGSIDRTKFFFYVSVTADKLNAWVDNLEVAFNNIEQGLPVHDVNDNFMAESK